MNYYHCAISPVVSCIYCVGLITNNFSTLLVILSSKSLIYIKNVVNELLSLCYFSCCQLYLLCGFITNNSVA